MISNQNIWSSYHNTIYIYIISLWKNKLCCSFGIVIITSPFFFLSVAADRVRATFGCRLFVPKAPAFLEILLMILLCLVEFLCTKDFRHNLPAQGLLVPLHRFSGSFFLFCCVEIYSRAILGPNIISLHANVNTTRLLTT